MGVVSVNGNSSSLSAEGVKRRQVIGLSNTRGTPVTTNQNKRKVSLLLADVGRCKVDSEIFQSKKHFHLSFYVCKFTEN